MPTFLALFDSDIHCPRQRDARQRLWTVTAKYCWGTNYWRGSGRCKWSAVIVINDPYIWRIAAMGLLIVIVPSSIVGLLITRGGGRKTGN
jgi:hypothetical protein